MPIPGPVRLKLAQGSTLLFDDVLAVEDEPTQEQYVAQAESWSHDHQAALPQSTRVAMFWCSNGTTHAESITRNEGESDQEFIDRAATWVHDQLTAHPPTNDCA